MVSQILKPLPDPKLKEAWVRIMANWAGQVAYLQISPAATEKLVSVRELRAVAGEGLEGDRYFKKIGTYSNIAGGGRQVTLIELESVEALKRDLKIELEPAQTRRNIVTRDVPLNHLVDRQFRLGGEVVLQGVRLCEPCNHLETLTVRGVREGLLHRAGLRADIIRGGTIKVGDPITPA
jgi:MOSC domain-containing protein YiiM